jgi:outer membrane protein OmpA-like peptidoglycan-associated protein
MSGQNRVVLFLSSLLLVFSIGTSTAKADCAGVLKQFEAAFSSRALPKVLDLEARIAKGEGSCSSADIQATRLSRAVLQFDMVKALLQKGAPQSEYEPLLLAASDWVWQAAVFIGNLKSKKKDYVQATLAYERAIELVKNRSATPDSSKPDDKTIREIVRSATESRSLAANEEARSGKPTYVAAAKDHRDGTVGGTMSVSIRDIKLTVVPLPIAFEKDSARLTEVGQRYADELLLALQQQAPPHITLVGHTDERGTAEHNMSLSDARVKTIAQFLTSRGITAKITTIAKGKSEPFVPTDPKEFSQEEIWALNRRVEWKR